MKPKLPKGNYSEGFLKFFNWLLAYLQENGKELEIHNTKYILKEGKCGGYCDGLKMVVAGKSPNFIPTIIHEAGHLEQTIDGYYLWDEQFFWDKFEIDSYRDLYKLILLERDCELRVLKFAKKWNITEISDYGKLANSYLFLHQFMFLKKKFVYHKNLRSKRILDLMPSKIVSEKELQYINMPLMQVYEEEFKKK